MPIKPENKARYPKNWKEIRASILQRANNKCEFCGIENYSVRENGSKVVLTIAHLDHTPENCNPENLRALCQKCHNTYDAEHRKETRLKTKNKEKFERQIAKASESWKDVDVDDFMTEIRGYDIREKELKDKSLKEEDL